MKIKFIAVFFTLFSFGFNCFADSPPCWCDFEKTSSNNRYTAKVFRDSSIIEKSSPIFVGWKLTVYDTKTKKYVWTIDYDYSGYPDGYVTDNGKSFVYVEYWYYDQSSLISIYTNGKKLNTEKITGHSFNINREKLRETVSHRLWLKEDGKFVKFISNKRDYIEISTIDNKVHKIDLSDGKKL